MQHYNAKKIIGIICGVAVIVGLYVVAHRDGRPSVFSSSTVGISEARQSEVVELKDGDTYNLTAGIVKKTVDGHELKMLAYNGSIPGPTIKVQQGSEITITFKNKTDVPTTLHSHGVRLDNAFDGVPGVTQTEVGIGQSFTYKLTFPDAGVFWYHPHVREDYAQELGLYGNYLVTPANNDYWGPVNREVPLFLDDISIEDGRIAPFGTKHVNHILMGRYGNVSLVNGDDQYQLQVKKGEVIRFYVTNSANVRPYNFAVAGMKMKLVGGDNGAYEKDTFVDSAILGPSERAVVEVLFGTAGSYELQNKTPDATVALGTVIVSEDSAAPSNKDSFLALKTHNDVVQSIDPFRAYFDKQIGKRLNLSIDMPGSMNQAGGHQMPDGSMMSNSVMMGNMMMGISKDGIEWEDTNQVMNQSSTMDTTKWKIQDSDTRKENMGINWRFRVGDKVKIRIMNDVHSMHPMQHPIHFHGQRFLVLDRNGVQQTNLVWKDTVLIPAGQYADILLDASNPGEWMAHCHIAEHLEDGMMFNFNVNP